jgi:hypothetical protein
LLAGIADVPAAQRFSHLCVATTWNFMKPHGRAYETSGTILMKNFPVTFNTDRQMIADLKAAAAADADRSVSSIIRRAIIDWLDRQDRPPVKRRPARRLRDGADAGRVPAATG